jgi:hypothetical protein
MKLSILPVLMLGATLVTPALAQSSNGASSTSSPAAASPAQPAQDANSAAVPAQTANSTTASDQTAMNSQPSTDASNSATSSSSTANTQLAMNTTGNAGDVSAVPDNQHKYSRAKRTAENRSEDQTTKQLNQQESSIGGANNGNTQ